MRPFGRLSAFWHIRKFPRQPLDFAAIQQNGHPTCSHLAVKVRRSGHYLVPVHQLLRCWSKLNFKQPKKSPRLWPASGAVSRSLVLKSRRMFNDLHGTVYLHEPLQGTTPTASHFSLVQTSPLTLYPARQSDAGSKSSLKKQELIRRFFSAHSARDAAASKAMATGVPVQSILNRGHWSRKFTFARFYRKTVPESAISVGASILCSLQGCNEI